MSVPQDGIVDNCSYLQHDICHLKLPHDNDTKITTSSTIAA